MIEYIFIIDFLENIQLDLPALGRGRFAELVKGARGKLISESKACDGVIERVADRGGNFLLFAKSNEENVTVCAVALESTAVKEKIWGVIDEILAEIADFDIESDDLASRRGAIQAIASPLMRPVASPKLKGSPARWKRRLPK